MRISIRPIIRVIAKPFKRAWHCPKCNSTDILGYGMIIGYGWINPDLSVNETQDDFEIFSDPKDLEFICRKCNHSWEE